MKNVLTGTVAALLVTILLMGISMYPVLRAPQTNIPAFYSTDEPYGVLWGFWWFRFAHAHHLSVSELSFIAHPYGLKVYFLPLVAAQARFISVLSDEVLAYNLLLFFTFIASACTMYWLSYYVCRQILVSIFAAMVFAFCPYHFVRVWQHFGAAQIQWIPLYILLLIKLYDDKRLLYSFLLGACFALNAYYEVHYAFFLLWVTVLYAAVILSSRAVSWAHKAVFARLLIVAAIAATLCTVPGFLPFMKQILSSRSAASLAHVYSFKRPFADLFAQSARPLSYVLPFTEHPLFGNFTKMFIGTQVWGESLTEHNIFIGYIPLFLVCAAFVKRKKIVTFFASRGIDIRLQLRFFLLLILFAWWMSQPPWWEVFGMKLYMPSFLLYKVCPSVRAYVRMAIVLMAGVSIVAACALSLFLDKIKQRVLRVGVFSLVLCSTMFEYYSDPLEHVRNVSEYPSVYDWLKSEPADVVIAEYPLDSNGPNELYKFYQTKHHKKIINGTSPNTPANEVARTIVRLSSPRTPGVLRSLGVRYVLVHRDAYAATELTQDRDELELLRAMPGLRFVAAFETTDVYEVTAQPEKPIVPLGGAR